MTVRSREGRQVVCRMFQNIFFQSRRRLHTDLSPTVLRDLRGLPKFATSICQCVVNGRQDTEHVADDLTRFEMAEVGSPNAQNGLSQTGLSIYTCDENTTSL
jgi:hypothetical protein